MNLKKPKLDEKVQKINFDNFEKQIQNKLDLKIKLFDDKLKELDKMNKDVNFFSHKITIK